MMKKILSFLSILLLIPVVFGYPPEQGELQVLDYHIIPEKMTYQPGEHLKITLKVTLPDLPNNFHDKQYVEVAILPEYLLKQWFGVPLSTYVLLPSPCDPAATNFRGRWVERNDYNPLNDPWEVELVVEDIQIPYPNMHQAEVYWAGEGRYYIVIYTTNGCYEELAPKGQYVLYAWAPVATIEVKAPEEEGGGLVRAWERFVRSFRISPLMILGIVMFIIGIVLLLQRPPRRIKYYTSEVK